MPHRTYTALISVSEEDDPGPEDMAEAMRSMLDGPAGLGSARVDMVDGDCTKPVPGSRFENAMRVHAALRVSILIPG